MIRLALALALGALGGCHAVFALEDLEESPAQFCNESGLRLCLDFEDSLDDGQAEDRSGNGNHALVANAMPAPRGSSSGVAIDASVVIQILDDPSHDIPRELTIELWFGYTALPADFAGLLDKDAQYGVTLGADGRAGCVLTMPDFDNVNTSSAQAIDSDTWHHLACVRTADSLLIYVDGSIAGTKGLPSTNPDTRTGSTRAMYLGRDDDTQTMSTSNPLTGYLDDVRIYDRALEATEIEQHFNQAR